MQENEPRKRGGIPIEKTRLTFCKKCGLRTRHEWHQWNHRSLLSLILGRINVIDGWGRAAYVLSMMVSLLLYAYCLGVRSSRQIERLCERDIGFRVIAGNRAPDHTTIARFRQANEPALAALLHSLCASRPGCFDRAARNANRGQGRIDRERSWV